MIDFYGSCQDANPNKMKMMKNTTVLLFLLTSVFVLDSCALFRDSGRAEDYEEGYYIQHGKQVDGYIYYSFTEYNQFYFRATLKDKPRKMTCKDAQAFSFRNRNFFVQYGVRLQSGSLSVHSGDAFAELIIEGVLSLYKIYSEIGNGSVIFAGQDPFMVGPSNTRVFTDYLLVKKSNKTFVRGHHNKGKFKKEVGAFLKDRPDIVTKIEEGKYNQGNIEDLVDDYNKQPG